ncbi:hypothetical protein [Phyllobacterium sophorae]|uniref:Uncharacterized protein n=1 Tax=Phyllobacterium sophorae TaxID=1520277 RepID=A0A2P7AXK0_9HYPH|nr:hypothetical protein [Phyllobacterium sophorae]PSH58914.1 hypothetical protein CU103_26920 [Phyllobacterium sophorae]
MNGDEQVLISPPDQQRLGLPLHNVPCTGKAEPHNGSFSLVWEYAAEPAMETEPRRILKGGNPVSLLEHETTNAQRCDPADWVEGMVISNYDIGPMVLFADDTREVIAWASGRICRAKKSLV